MNAQNMELVDEFNYLTVFFFKKRAMEKTRNFSRNKSEPNICTCRQACIRTATIFVK
jgi:hypothetical protein